MLLCYISSSLLTFAVNKLMEMPVRYFDQNQAGDIISPALTGITLITIPLQKGEPRRAGALPFSVCGRLPIKSAKPLPGGNPGIAMV